jgi:hypothetical protein
MAMNRNRHATSYFMNKKGVSRCTKLGFLVRSTMTVVDESVFSK